MKRLQISNKILAFLATLLFLMVSGQTVRAWNNKHDLTGHLPHLECTSPKNPKLRELVQKEQVFEEKGDYLAALEISKKLWGLERNECASNTIAGLYGTLGHFAEEIEWAKNSIKFNPKYINAYINLGNALAALENINDARIAYIKAKELAPTNPLPIYSLGVLSEKENKFSEAAKLYQKSIELDAQFEDGYFNLAAMKANMREFESAKTLLKQLLKINPDDVDAKEMLHRLPK